MAENNQKMSETEQYWIDYFERQQHDPMKKNVVGITMIEDFENRKAKFHHLEHYSMCKSENPYIRQIRRSPNITSSTVAELICRGTACDLQYCMSLQKIALEQPKRNIELNQCKSQRKNLSACLIKEGNRLEQKEKELRELVLEGKIPGDSQQMGIAMAKETEEAVQRVQKEYPRERPVQVEEGYM